METISILKDDYDYSFHRMSFFINKQINKITCLYYWTSNNPLTHHLYIKGEERHLSVTIRLTGTFRIPDEKTLRYGRRWFIRLPRGYDINTFIHEILFRQNREKPFYPVKTFFGITPVMENKRCHEYRKRIKRLIQSLDSEIKSGTLDYHTAATHFSASTGLAIQASLRYFRQYNIPVLL
ncbi:hypothetical protein AIW19_24525 [Salmonella enterica]|nr:hypothetical protein [Salmonella enterica]EDB1996510.1 hypothetical protein [Salmonella enterica subsp. enterica serovar Haifa]EDD4629260.1 hypothetical protein [Salmonella enterica subsp. enterica serovar Newport]EHG7423043.1 hypothetical protein [Salmonella enterica subsp. enterica serovar Saintpaul]EBQ5112869.1 hypothetical protein [Salmonella enterica]